ncbi:MAG: MerR family transcriptional regulator [Gemmatimonadales bacterium]
MRISELAGASGVPVATIKFYLRERLLPEGRLTSPTQAQYDEGHLARLQLIRALTGPGGLTLAATRDVLQHIDDPPASMHQLLGYAHGAVSRPPADQPGLDRVHAVMRGMGWRLEDKDRSTQLEAAAALAALDAAGFELPEGALETYARTMYGLAEMELANVPTEPPAAAVRYVVLGTVLVEPLLLALRRMAQQEASARRFSQH